MSDAPRQITIHGRVRDCAAWLFYERGDWAVTENLAPGNCLGGAFRVTHLPTTAGAFRGFSFDVAKRIVDRYATELPKMTKAGEAKTAGLLPKRIADEEVARVE